MTAMKVKQKRKRGPNRLKETEAFKLFYSGVLQPFFRRYTLNDEQSYLRDGVEAFFNTQTRSTLWCAAVESFTLPGLMWSDPSHPFHLVQGVGRRYVKKGDGFVLRQDSELPDRNEIEFEEQVFVLTEAELNAIKSKFKTVA